jgi:hypothetical protein
MTINSLGRVLCGGFLFAGLVSASAPAAAKSKTVNCSPTTLTILTSTIIPYSNTKSTTYVDIPEATVSFKQGGTVASCVIVRFSAAASSNADGVTIRPLLDVSTTALPVEIPLAGMECIPTVGCTTRSHSFEFVFPHVAPGKHLLRMQFEAAFGNGSGVFVGPHNTVVQHAP